jgi:hypothetical protein
MPYACDGPVARDCKIERHSAAIRGAELMQPVTSPVRAPVSCNSIKTENGRCTLPTWPCSPRADGGGRNVERQQPGARADVEIAARSPLRREALYLWPGATAEKNAIATGREVSAKPLWTPRKRPDGSSRRSRSMPRATDRQCADPLRSVIARHRSPRMPLPPLDYQGS